MRQSRYLNVILTVNAVLLAGLLYTQVVNEPLFATEANAQSRTKQAKPADAMMATNTQQRAAIDEALRDQVAAVEKMAKLLQSGKVRVEVTNVGDFRKE